MCTVSFVPVGNKIVLTSNRDEQSTRPSLAPDFYQIGDKTLLFPKDPRAGGTWFAADESGNVLVLLNGAAEAHEMKPPYRKSRGLVVLELLSEAEIVKSWETYQLDGIEPFTIVAFTDRKLWQLRWNGDERETLQLNEDAPRLWSSATLYPKDVREARQQWFSEFLVQNPKPSENDLLHFHRYAKSGDLKNGLIIERENFLRTLSITQAVIENGKIRLSHHNLVDDSVSEHTFSRQKS